MPKKTTVKKSIVKSCIAESRSIGRVGAVWFARLKGGRSGPDLCTEEEFGC